MPAPIFNGRLQIFSSTSGGTSDFVITGLFFDETSTFLSSAISVDDMITDANGFNYKIVVVNTVTSFDVSDEDANGAPQNGAGNICRPTANKGIIYPTRIANGINEFLQNHIYNVAIATMDSAVGATGPAGEAGATGPTGPAGEAAAGGATSALLVEVEAAISTSLKGKTVSVDGVSYTTHDIDKLYAIRKDLKTKLAQEDGSSRTVSQADMSAQWN